MTHKGTLLEVREAWQLMQIGHPDAVKCMKEAHTKLDALIEAVPDKLGEHIEETKCFEFMDVNTWCGSQYQSAKLLHEATTPREE